MSSKTMLLIGREQETAQLRERLPGSSQRLTTLIGPGGAGKTALAEHVASGSRRAFEGGVAVVELASVTAPELVMSVVCQSLGVQDAGTRPLIDSLLAHLQDRHVLVVLDNCEHVLAAAAAAAEVLLRCPRVHILATSREPLRMRECVYPLAPLALPPRAEQASVRDLRGSPAVASAIEYHVTFPGWSPGSYPTCRGCLTRLPSCLSRKFPFLLQSDEDLKTMLPRISSRVSSPVVRRSWSGSVCALSAGMQLGIGFSLAHR